MRRFVRLEYLTRGFKVLVAGVLITPLMYTGVASAGTLTNLDFDTTSTQVGAQADYTFHYTNENEVPTGDGTDVGAVFEATFNEAFGFSEASASVLIDDTPATIDQFTTFSDTVVRVQIDEVVPDGSDIKVTLHDVTNPTDPGTFQLPIVHTINAIGGEMDYFDTNDEITTVLPAVSFAGGTGSSGDPYQITTCTMLQGMYTDVDAHYKLTSNVDCSASASWNGGKGFNPVGYPDPDFTFTGSLDGNGYKISNLTILRADNNQGDAQGDEEYVGLFGSTLGATLTDVVVENSKIQGYLYVGGLIGYMEGGTIENSSFNLTTEDNSCSPGHCVWARYGNSGGGLVGYMASGTITHSQTAGPVKGSGTVIGGLVGYMLDGTVEFSSSGSNIDGGTSLGGAVGEMEDGLIQGVTASGDVYANVVEDFKQGRNSGGLVGVMKDGMVKESSASGDVHVEAQSAGGLIGLMEDGAVNDAFATGDVLSDVNRAGGLIGDVNGGDVYRTYATGNVTASNSDAGGLIGSIDSASKHIEVSNSFAKAHVSSDGAKGGLIGIINDSDLIMSDMYFDQTAAGTSACSDTFPTAGWCAPVNVSGNQDDYFTHVANAPFSAGSSLIWPGDIWYINDNLPQLMSVPPVMLCEQPSGTATSVSATCMVYPPGAWGTPTWEARYRKVGTSSYTNVTLANVNVGSVTVTGLTPDTEYEVQLRYTNDYGTSEWGTVWTETISGADSDNDDIPDAEENAAPNGGDGNNDGIQDSQQSNVSSLVSGVNGKYVTVAVDNPCTLDAVSIAAESNASTKDSGFDYPAGLLNFSADCGTPGFVTTVKVYSYGVEKDGMTLRKYNPTNEAYFSLIGEYGGSLSQQKIGGKTVTVATYDLMDGGDLDIDGLQNGILVDPVGVASRAVGVPNTGIQ